MKPNQPSAHAMSVSVTLPATVSQYCSGEAPSAKPAGSKHACVVSTTGALHFNRDLPQLSVPALLVVLCALRQQANVKAHWKQTINHARAARCAHPAAAGK